MHLPSSSSRKHLGKSSAPQQDEASRPEVNRAGAASKSAGHDDEDDDIDFFQGAEVNSLTNADDENEIDIDADIDSDSDSDSDLEVTRGTAASMLVKKSQCGAQWDRGEAGGPRASSSSRLRPSIQSGEESGDEDMTDGEGGASLEKMVSATADSDLTRLADVALTYSDSDSDSRSCSDSVSDDGSEDSDSGSDHARTLPYLSNLNHSAHSASDSDEYGEDNSDEEQEPGLYISSQAHGGTPSPLASNHPGTIVIMDAPVVTDWTGGNEALADLDLDEMMLPPLLQSNPNPSIPGSENLGLVDFLRLWAYRGGGPADQRSSPPYLGHVLAEADKEVTDVKYSDLNGDKYDFQALDWTAMETTRRAARSRRHRTYKNYVNHEGSDMPMASFDNEDRSPHESYFRFRRMHIRRDVRLAHFQLRSVLACPSRTHAYYPTLAGVSRINTLSGQTETAMSTREFPAMGGPISALDADCGVLLGGTFSGEYFYKSLDCEDVTSFREGQITSDFSNITNHVKVYQPRRSAGPVAAIASNDCGFRIMDLETERFVSDTTFPFALNCSALSPDQRLRVVVGDSSTVLITNSDTGEVLQSLSGHRDYGFSCDWSEDGRTVATGFQDRAIKIWDARKWCNSSGVATPMHTVRSEMASARGLRFSPLGSGRPVLVAAEETDFVNLIDAQTFDAKQTIDVFGEIGGVSFTNEGQDLNVLCCDPHRGGLLQLERCGRGPEPALEHIPPELPSLSRWTSTTDLPSTEQRPVRSRRPGLLEEMEPF